MRCERSLGGEELVEHPPGPALMADIVLAVEDADAVDEDAVDAFRVADGAPPAAGQVGDAARRRDADRRRIEEQEIGEGAGLDPPAPWNAVEVGLMAGQPADALDQVELAALANPAGEEVETEPGVAHIDEVGAGIGQRDDARLVVEEGAEAFLDDVEELAEEG